MITIVINKAEYFDDATGTFIYTPEYEMNLEHSLRAISKWESRWQKPFLGSDNRTPEEIFDYIKCMIVNDIKPSDIMLQSLKSSDVEKISNYIQSSNTATTIRNNGKPSREIITSELIYYWMISANIPFECQDWHLNRLLTLINVCQIKNAPPKKENKKDVMTRNHALNAARKKAMKTSG